VIAELDWGARVRLDQLPQERPALQERATSQVLAIEVQEVESKEHEPVWRRVDGRAQGVEVGNAVLILDEALTTRRYGPVQSRPQREKTLTLPLPCCALLYSFVEGL
jgi:hypothetical protein